MTDHFETISLSVEEGVAVLTLNRPHRLNAINAAMRAELALALDIVEQEAASRCLLITGAGRSFCPGQDLGERQPLPDGRKHDLSQALDREYNPLMRRLADFEKPIVCAVNGVAAGAGVSLALSADICFAAESARFILAFVNIGLAPDCGATWILPRLIGQQRALNFAMSGEPISASIAEQWGMIMKSVPDAELMEQAMAHARNLAAKAPQSICSIRRNIRAAWCNSFTEQLDLERDTQQRLGYTEDYSEGIRAFTERQSPRFTGR